MEARPSAVIKLGGSLLGLPDLPARLANYLRDFSRPRPILTCGGGAAVDLVRKWDRIYGIGEEPSHWIALRILSIHCELVSRILPDHLVLVDTPQDCALAWSRGLVPVYDAHHYITDYDESSDEPLPRRWRVTSDSIAAAMAVTFGAPELVLLKSRTLPERLSFLEAVERELVDPHFPVVARRLDRVVSFNLRGAAEEETVLYDSEAA